MAARCYFVPAARSDQQGQYQWWNLRSSGRWACDMWMNVGDGVMRHALGSREDETLVDGSYFEGNGGVVRVW